MPLIADCLTDAQSADLAALPTRRSALIERDGHLNWKGERCAPCTYCGSIFVASALRAMNGAALACKRCNEERAGNG